MSIELDEVWSEFESLALLYGEAYNKETIEELFKLINQKVEEAEAAGYTDIVVEFRSTQENFSPDPSNVEVKISGYRAPNEVEKKRMETWAEEEALAERLGISYSSAELLLGLLKSGKVELK